MRWVPDATTTRRSSPRVASSTSWPTETDSARLDDNYTVFGQVIKGMDVVETIVSVPTDSTDAPLVPIPLTVSVIEMTAAQLEELGFQPGH